MTFATKRSVIMVSVFWALVVAAIPTYFLLRWVAGRSPGLIAARLRLEAARERDKDPGGYKKRGR